MGGFGRVVVVLFVAACGAPSTKGPAWPEPAKSDKDGGESLAPHESKQMTVALEKTDDAPAPKKTEATAAAATPAAQTEGGAPAATSATPTIEDVITTDEIIIEIDE